MTTYIYIFTNIYIISGHNVFNQCDDVFPLLPDHVDVHLQPQDQTQKQADASGPALSPGGGIVAVPGLERAEELQGPVRQVRADYLLEDRQVLDGRVEQLRRGRRGQ